jgi:prenylcysteine oxidase/farnesylcysteine lyase
MPILQSIDNIHGLGATVSLAASGGVRVKGGNRRNFEQFVQRSGAEVFLRTKVSDSSTINLQD